MSSLPPYSTYRTDNKQQMLFPQATSHGNILTFTPPGFKQSLNVKFPDSRLAVCEKCKKNFKTRDMCRVRNTHTSPPWTTAYICITLDDSCTDENGEYIDKPLTVRMIQWQPFCARESFDPKTPVCASCKKTNRTRGFCRERHKHLQLPWCTVYVLLSALDAVDPATVVAGASKPVPGDSKIPATDAGDIDVKSDAATTSAAGAGAEESPSGSRNSESADGVSENTKPDDGKKSGDDGDDINDIAESRTFLAKVSSHDTSIQWLNLADMAGEESMATLADNYNTGVAAQAMDSQQYYGTMFNQNPQSSLKNNQQYFYNMQQNYPHHYAAQQAAWNAHYQRHTVHPTQPHSPAAGAPATGGDQSPATSAPVTAGEAAAQQQKRNRQMTEEGSAHTPTPPPPPPTHALQANVQPHWAVYQQMYQAQIPPGQPSPYAHAPTQEGGQHALTPSDQQYTASEALEGNGNAAHAADSKRQRLV